MIEGMIRGIVLTYDHVDVIFLCSGGVCKLFTDEWYVVGLVMHKT